MSRPEPRLPIVLVVDASAQTAHAILPEFTHAFPALLDGLLHDPLARSRIELAVVTFGSDATLHIPFQGVRTISSFSAKASGSSNMAAAINLALDQLEARTAKYRAELLEYFRPWLFMITAGTRADFRGFDAAVQRLNAAEVAKLINVFVVGVGGDVDWEQLNQLSRQRLALHLDGLAFSEMLRWLSASLSSVTGSSNHGLNDAEREGSAMPVPLPFPGDWADL